MIGEHAINHFSGQKGATSPHEAFYYYHTTQLQAVRSGQWKLILPQMPRIDPVLNGKLLGDVDALRVLPEHDGEAQGLLVQGRHPFLGVEEHEQQLHQKERQGRARQDLQKNEENPHRVRFKTGSR